MCCSCTYSAWLRQYYSVQATAYYPRHLQKRHGQVAGVHPFSKFNCGTSSGAHQRLRQHRYHRTTCYSKGSTAQSALATATSACQRLCNRSCRLPGIAAAQNMHISTLGGQQLQLLARKQKYLPKKLSLLALVAAPQRASLGVGLGTLAPDRRAKYCLFMMGMPCNNSIFVRSIIETLLLAWVAAPQRASLGVGLGTLVPDRRAKYCLLLMGMPCNSIAFSSESL